MVQKNLKKILQLCHIPKWLFALLIVVMILRIPTFFEPYSYGDEMIYLTLGEGIRQGVPLYSGLHDNKPPLLYITAAIAGSLFWFKAILAIWHLVTIFLFWKLTEVLFPSGPEASPGRRPEKTTLHKVATIIFALFTTIPLLEGNIVNAELFMLGPTILAFIILLSEKLTPKNLFFSGVLFSVSALYKIPAAFDMPVIVIFWLLTNSLNKKNLITIVRNTTYLVLGFLFPIAVIFVWFAIQGAFREYSIAVYLQNFGYLSSWRPDDVQKSFIEKNGPLILRSVIVLIGIVILYIKRKRLSKQFLFLSAWLLLGLFAVTLSERPYPHYLIQIVPPASFFAAILFNGKNIEQSLAIIPLTLTFIIPVYFEFWYYPTTPYYTRFIKLATGQISQRNYLETFGDGVVRNYKISEFLVRSTSKKDKVFVWGNSSVVYALSRRLPPIKYVADYHINDFSGDEEVLSSLVITTPKIIVVLPDSRPFPELLNFLRRKYIQLDPIEGAQIWNLLGNEAQDLIAQ